MTSNAVSARGNFVPSQSGVNVACTFIIQPTTEVDKLLFNDEARVARSAQPRRVTIFVIAVVSTAVLICALKVNEAFDCAGTVNTRESANDANLLFSVVKIRTRSLNATGK